MIANFIECGIVSNSYLKLRESKVRSRATIRSAFAVIMFLSAVFSISSVPSQASSPTPQCITSNLSLGFGNRISAMTGEHATIFTLTNHGKLSCHLYGHPGVSFYDSKGRVLPFRYTWTGTQYMSQSMPKVIVLHPGARAYFLVAHYRCDVGIAMEARTVRVYPPNATKQLFGRAAPSANVGGFTYCKGGVKDPGQLVEVSPVRATPHFF
jgi:hypothetical protein